MLQCLMGFRNRKSNSVFSAYRGLCVQVDEDELYWDEKKGDEESAHSSAHVISQLSQCLSE